MKQFNELLASCKEVAFDLRFTKAANWKLADKSRAIVGFLPKVHSVKLTFLSYFCRLLNTNYGRES